MSQLDDTLPADALERMPAPQQPGHLPAPMTELLDSIRAEVAPEAYGQEDPESPEWAEIERLPPLPHRRADTWRRWKPARHRRRKDQASVAAGSAAATEATWRCR